MHKLRLPNLSILLANIFGLAVSIRVQAQVTDVTVGITPTCPYGCWPGAISAIRTFDNVADVDLRPDANTLTLRLKLKDERLLPTPEKWKTQFESIVHQAYIFRGVEVTARGILRKREGWPMLELPDGKLMKLIALTKPVPKQIAKNPASRPSANEVSSPRQLILHNEVDQALSVTGTLHEGDDHYILEVRAHERLAK